MVQVEQLRPLAEQGPFGEPGRPARVHQHDRFVLLGLIGHGRHRSRKEVLVTQVVWGVALTDQDDPAEGQVLAHLGDAALEMLGEEPVDEDHLRPRVGEDELQLLAGQTEIERVDDPCSPRIRRGTARGTGGRWRPSPRSGHRDGLRAPGAARRTAGAHARRAPRRSRGSRRRGSPSSWRSARRPATASGGSRAPSWSPAFLLALR